MTTNIYTNKNAHPGYLYCCIHPETKEHYIGVRTANNLPPTEDFGHVYRTSSKIVKPRFDEFDSHILFASYDHQGLYILEQMLINSCVLANKTLVLNKAYRDVTKPEFVLKNCPIVGNHHSTETKQKIKKSNIGKVVTAETKEKLRKKATGRKATTITKQRMSSQRKGAANPMYGKNQSELCKETNREYAKTHYQGENNPFFGKKHSDSAKEKNRQAHLGNKHTKEAKNKMSAKRKGVSKSKETKKKMKENNAKYWLGKKQARCSCTHCKKEVSINNLTNHYVKHMPK